jgi:hypothetical protein
MFLKELYHYNKFLFTSLVVFILGSTLVYYKWGAVTTPIYQYGMFCKNFYEADTQKVYQLYINNKPVNYSEFNQHDLDMTQEVLYNYKNQKKINAEIYQTMKGFYNKISIGRLMTEQNYLNTISDEEFITWFATKIPRNKSVNATQLKIELHEYLYQQKHLNLVKTTKIIDSLAFVN